LQAAVYAPHGAGTDGRRYPIIVSVYGGPHAQTVADNWPLTVDLRAQFLAQEGYVVVKVDNRGSANRGLSFEAAIAGDMGRVEVEDQIAGVRWLSERPYADGGRVGIYGWSYGGYMTCMALLRAPDLFRVGVAGAPVTHWDGYDTHYTERYMGHPATNAEGYRESSPLTHVAALRGKLLLIHGMIDENVHFRHTARLIAALTGAGKAYDLLIFPGERHMPRDARGLEYQESRLVDYFRAHL
jgi:dipeptidyl-peptidase 4